MKNKNARSPRQGVEANGLDKFDWKKNLPGRALSPSVFFGINVRQSQIEIKLTDKIELLEW